MPFDVAMNAPSITRCLADLLDNLSDDLGTVPVTGVTHDSRMVQPGVVFFALPGTVVDGAKFAPQAVRHGASAVVAERPLDLDVPVIVVANARRAMAEAAARFFGHPDRDISLIGVVGTNGKSTIASGLHSVTTRAGIASGLIGTIEYRWGSQTKPAPRTTPEATDLFDFLNQMRDDGVRAAAVEVSSHAIALDRVWGINFAGGIFTNITRDHLDYHHTMEEYRRVKGTFFERLQSNDSFAAINIDDATADYFLDAARASRIIRYSVSQPKAEVLLTITEHSPHGSQGSLEIAGHSSVSLTSPLWGAFNHSNLAAIAAAAHGMGIEPSVIADGLAHFDGIPGRTERVPSSAPFDVFIDYAHTPDALDVVLSAARDLVKGRLLVVFGCGGDRDRGKRAEMAQAVERWADQTYLTSDNPRSEDPLSIIADVKQGFSAGTQVFSDPDRVRAIERSITDATTGDTVFLCGKGHEETQEVAGVFHRFSDRETAVRILAAHGHAPQTPRGGGLIPGSAVGPGGDPSPSR
jgi:UDP-N-acetylmuramoyl-L-alanyl-D-glutamate--2,6-diaminopimelate ligase